MTSILFKNSNRHRSIAIGQFIQIITCCYLKAKELDCDEIYMEWINTRFLWDDMGNSIDGFGYQSDTILPFIFLNVGEEVNTDITIDIGLPNSLYDGCEPLIDRDFCKLNPSSIYILDYTTRNKKLPRIYMDRKETKEKYILIHYRKSTKKGHEFRKINDEWYVKLVEYLRSKYNYKIYKIGEQSPFEDIFDRRFPYFTRNFNRLMELINNCELYITCPTGPWGFAVYFDKPMIAIATEKSYNIELDVSKKILNDNQLLVIDDFKNRGIIENHINKVLGG